ncbi:MAG: S9 family peptidase [Chloroflexi bacterium]|nr:S9 family peptidase [Chloroflexota bacterium]
MNPQIDTSPVWKERYKLAKVGWAKVARLAPERAIVATDKTSDLLQLHAVDMHNGRSTQITHKKDGVPLMNVHFSPDGNYVYYVDDLKGNELGHLVRMPYEGGDVSDVTPNLPDYSVRGVGFSLDEKSIGLVAVTPEGYHLYTVNNLPDGTVSEPRLIYHDQLEFWQAELSANGRYIGIISTRQTKTRLYSVVIFDTQTGEEVGELWDGAESSVNLTCFSPVNGDDRVLGVSSKSGWKRPYLWNPITNQRTDFDFPQLEGDILAWDWSTNGNTLLLCHSYRAQQQLYTFDLQTETLTKLNHPTGVYEFSIGPFGTFAHFLPNGNIYALWESAAHPPQLAEFDGQSGHKTRTIVGPDKVISGRPWQSVTYTSSDGTNIQGWLSVPEGDGPFPTILNMHGGPHYMVSAGYNPSAQAWVNHGFAYFTINFRGSTGFGDMFKSQIWGNLGHWELEDMVAARNWLVENNIAQSNAIILNGGSYGGYLTLWGLARRPDLWAGGLASVAIADWVVNYEDAADAMKGAFTMWHGGTLEDVRERYIKSSPITYVENISAPLLVIQGYNDTRTTQRQMEEFEARMKSMGKPIDMLWFDAGHGGISTDQVIEFQEKQLELALKIVQKQ